MRRFTRTALALVVPATLCIACADQPPSAPSRSIGIAAAAADRQTDEAFSPELQKALATMRAATAPYHDIQNALKDGYELRVQCESEEGGAVGSIYSNRTNARDGKIDPALPDGLIYESTPNGP